MTSLPSFVDLMASLGLEQKEHPTSKPSSLLYSAPPTLSMTRSHSAPSRHPTIQKQRYSPYFSAAAPKRRGSLSSATLGPEQTLRRHDRCQSVGVGKQNSVYQATNFIDSTSDAGANAPISTYQWQWECTERSTALHSRAAHAVTK
ncbi:hypothetical protein APHAL10511_001990 [Amanita phalloides]|nr:hypothetical protein APHAL10511_001990 [Amanita phalloides]